MYLLACLTILGTAFGVPLTSTDDDGSRNLGALYVLPADTIPTFYDVRLFLDPRNTDYFFGNVSIRIMPYVATNRIVMHAMEMNIDSVVVVGDRSDADLFANYTLASDDTHFLTIMLTTQLQPFQPYTVHISYTSQFALNMFGVYVSTYEQNGVTV